MGKIISFINFKGGVGKTTCCMNIAATLALENNKVLAVDLDAQHSLSVALLGPERYSAMVRMDRQCIYLMFSDAINRTENFSLDDVIIQSAVEFGNNPPLPRLDLLPSSIDLHRLEREIVTYERTKARILYDNLEIIKNSYDFILIDCPPNIYTATNNALYASDYYVIPTIPEFLSVTGIPMLVRNLKDISDIKEDDRGHDTKLAGIIINMFNQRLSTIHEPTVTRVEEVVLPGLIRERLVHSSAKIFRPCIRNLAFIKKAYDAFVPACAHDPRSDSTAEFRECTHDIINHIEEIELEGLN